MNSSFSAAARMRISAVNQPDSEINRPVLSKFLQFQCDQVASKSLGKIWLKMVQVGVNTCCPADTRALIVTKM